MKKLLSRLKKKPNEIVLVSGLPRSGTSMMMKMLAAGGLPPLTDHLREPDDDNPKGYYEFERVKKLREGDADWLPLAAGKAVKIISALLEYLPPDYHYRVLFMRREMSEILASQRRMLIRRGEDPAKVDDGEMAGMFEKHLLRVTTWLSAQPYIDVLYVHYNDVLSDPENMSLRIARFLNRKLDIQQMQSVVDPGLYRQRAEDREQPPEELN